VNAALVGQRQNDEMTRLTEASYQQNEQVKRISSVAAILFAPTLIAGIYGMNFTTCRTALGARLSLRRRAHGAALGGPLRDLSGIAAGSNTCVGSARAPAQPRARRLDGGHVSLLAQLYSAIAAETVEIVDLTAPLSESTPVLQLPEPFTNTIQLPARGDQPLRRAWAPVVLEQHPHR